MMAGFNLNNAMSGLGQGLAEVGGVMHDTAVKKAAEIDLLSIRHQNDLARDQALSRLRVGEHEAIARSDIAMMPEKGRIESNVLAEREDLTRPSRMQTAREKSDIDVSQKLREPRTLAAGASEVIDGKVAVTAPQKEQPQEYLNYLNAHANELNARAKAIEREGLRAGRVEKPQFPNVIQAKDPDGQVTGLIDTHSGAVGTVVPGKAAVPGETHWFKANEPGKPATPAHIEWEYNGQRVQLSDLYPSISTRSGNAGAAPASAPVPGARQANDGKWYVEKEGKYYPVIDAPAAKPTASTATPAKAPPATPEESYIRIQRGGYVIDAPPRSPAARLNGRSFPSKEEALRAIRGG